MKHQTLLDLTRCALAVGMLVSTASFYLMGIYQHGQPPELPGSWWALVGGAVSVFVAYELPPGGTGRRAPGRRAGSGSRSGTRGRARPAA